MKTFEQYLQETHAQGYRGTDDDMPDDFENWLSQWDAADIMEFAEHYGRELQLRNTK